MHSAKRLFAALLCLFSAGVQAVTLSELGQSALNSGTERWIPALRLR